MSSINRIDEYRTQLRALTADWVPYLERLDPDWGSRPAHAWVETAFGCYAEGYAVSLRFLTVYTA